VNAIAARGDLAVTNPWVGGATDSKITSSQRALNMTSDAVCGPTHDQQKPFSWTQFPSWPHVGMPMTWDFEWMTMSNL
jgi:hypothetical protein